MYKIIIFGKNGQVASDLIKIFNQEKNKLNYKIYNYSSSDIDFNKLDNLEEKLSKLPKSDIIINATSYNYVDKAEDNYEIANNINNYAIGKLAKYCQNNNIIFIHYSTNYVFDGKGGNPYKENNISNLNPLSNYGITKLAGERQIIKYNPKYLILRLATVFNLEKDNNFIYKIKKKSSINKEIKIVKDQITNPTNSYDIALSTINIINQIITKKEFTSSIYHLASKNNISYYDFVKDYILKDNNDIKIIAIKTSDLEVKAKRPLNGALDSSKIKQDFNIEIKNITL